VNAIPVLIASFAAVASILSGCVYSGPPVANRGGLCDPKISKMGPNIFLADDGCGGTYAMQVGDEMCRRAGMEFIVQRRDANEIIFRCLKPGERYAQPIYQRDPAIIIQDNRR
jgi:hypothetical protein